MTIQDFHKDIRLMVPESDGRYFSPDDIDNFIFLSVLDQFDQNYKVFEESQRVTDILSFYKAQQSLAAGAGIVALPTDLVYLSSLMATKINGVATEKPITLLTDQFANNIFSSEAFGPTEDDPYGQRFPSSLKVRPLTIGEVTINYLRRPTKQKYGYTTSVNGFSKVYNPGTSVEIDAPFITHTDLMNKTLRYMGIPLNKPALVQAESVARAGNQPEAR